MGACLTDQDLAAYVDGSAAAEQMSAWNEHLDDCDACAASLARKHAVRTGATNPSAPATPAALAEPDETVTVKPPADAALDAGAGLPENAIPGYRILKELHRGGQGVVYQAIQEAAKRKVALKVMLEGPFASKDAKRRFEREIALVGSLRHPGIVPIFDSGVAQGRFYYAMEYIRGERLNEYVQSRKLRVDDTLRLLEKVCDAVDYAHQKGVIHRDLKPSNILVDNRGDPYVLDFGLAKIGGAEADETLVSVTGQVMGTPAYMSPEQASGRPDEVDMRSDVYALGVVLYEALTGQHPYDVAGELTDVLRNIKEEAPRRPSTIRRQINDEVETIVLKALSKEKPRRYATAGTLGEDIGRLLAGEPIEAKRDSALYVLRKALRRYKAPAAIAVAFLLLLTVSSIVAWTLYGSAVRARDAEAALRIEADAARQAERHLTFNMAIDRGLALCDQSHVGRGMLWLARALELAPTEAAEMRRVIRANLAAWSRELHSLEAMFPHDQGLQAAAFSPDGAWILTGGYDGKAHLWDARTGRRIRTLLHDGSVHEVTFSPDGSRVLTASYDNWARLWDPKTGTLLWKFAHEGLALGAAFSPDGSWFVTSGADGNVKLWDADNQDSIGELPKHSHAVHDIAISSDGLQILTACHDGMVRLWDLETRGEPIARFPHQTRVPTADFRRPDGSQIVTGDGDGNVWLWDVATEASIRRWRHRGRIHRLRVSRDGSRILTASFDSTARLWDPDMEAEVGAPFEHQAAVQGVAFSPDGSRIAVACEDNAARLWRPAPGRSPLRTVKHEGIEGPEAVFTRDGRCILTRGENETASVFDAATGAPIGVPFKQPGGIYAVAVSPDRSKILTGNADSTARLWDAATGKPLFPPFQHGGSVYGADFSPDGKRMLTTAFDGTVRLGDVETGGPIGEPLKLGLSAWGGAFSPDGSRIVVTSADKMVRLVDANTGKILRTFSGHQGSVWGAAFSRDGTRIVSGGFDNAALVWDVATGNPVSAPMPHPSPLRFAVAFSPDGRTVMTGCDDGTARIWDVATAKPIGPALTHDASVRMVAFTTDGSQILTGTVDRTTRLWDVSISPLAADVPRITLWLQVRTGFELDADGTSVALNAETWRQRRAQLYAMGGPPIP